MELFSREVKTEVGALRLVADSHALVAVLWQGDDPKRVPLPEWREARAHPVLDQAERQLEEYFEARRAQFDLPIRFIVGTEFQKRVWSALLEIPHGETRTYGALAAGIGRPGASRAVGVANSRNPVSIIVPCHRVIGADGKLTGFAGGLAVKKKLLDLERGFSSPGSEAAPGNDCRDPRAAISA